MKILFMANIPSPYRVKFFDELGKYCDLTVTFEGKKATDRDAGWKARATTNFYSVYLKGIRTSSDQFLCPGIVKILNRSFDHIIVGGYSTPTSMLAIEYMRFRRIPFWIEADGGIISNDNKLKYGLKRHLISSASAWLSSGKVTTEYLVHYGAKREKTYVYPFTSVSTNQILDHVPTKEKKEKLRQQLGMTEGKIIISVGQFIHRKGFDILLHTAAQLPKDIGVYIIGGKPTDDYLQIKKEMNLQRVHFVDFMPTDQLSKYYQAADAFVFPTREDIWGLVVNEAMANGLPVITTERCVAGLELVKNGENGYIVPVDDADALAEAVTKFYAGDMRSMAEEALRAIRGYTIEEMAKKHLRLMDFDNNLGIKYDEL